MAAQFDLALCSDAGSNELVKAVIAEIETSEGRSAIEGALLKRFASTKPADVAAS